MAVIGGYYNSRGGDRRYNAEDMSKYFTGLFTPGVLETVGDKLSVNAAVGMTVTVGTGKAYFRDGKWIENTALMTLKMEAAPVIQSRIDRIVMRNDRTEDERTASIYVLAGTPAENPVAPPLTRNEYVDEMGLAQIRVARNVKEITAANITDERPIDAVCGFVYALGQKVSVEDLYRQHQGIFDDFMGENQVVIDQIEKDEVKRLANEKGRVSAETARVTECNRAVSGADDAAKRAQKASDEIDGKVGQAVTAATEATKVAESVRNDADTGKFNGRDGAPGIVTKLEPGMFGLAIDHIGHLVMTHNNNEPQPPMSVTESGHLIYTID